MIRNSTLALLLAAVAMASCAPRTDLASRPPVVAALDPQEQRFTADFESFMTESLRRIGSVPGVSVAIARSDGPIYLRGFGMADIERGVPATPDARFYIASSTKSFVALAFASLERKGLIDLDWTLAELAPDVQFASGIRPREITLRHLLSHSHGLNSQGMEHRLAYSGEHDAATLWRLLGRVTPNTQQPLGTFNYGNIGYNIAAMLVERRLGRRWQDILQEEVLGPLGATQTHAQGLEALRRTQPFAAPYMGIGPNGPERLNLLKIDSNMQSAGGMFASANDLARWLRLQLAAHKGARDLPLPADLVAATHAPVVAMTQSFGPFARAGYGLGWYSGPFNGDTLYHSFGGYTGARSHVSFMPSRDLGVAIVTNDEGAGAMFVDIAALFAYRWFQAGPEAARSETAPLVDRLVAEAQRRVQAVAEDRARRASRTWRLTQPRAAYAGRYCNADYGTISVTLDGDRIAFNQGAMNAVATPYTDPDTMRIELIPGNGMVVAFRLEGGRAARFAIGDRTFERCG